MGWWRKFRAWTRPYGYNGPPPDREPPDPPPAPPLSTLEKIRRETLRIKQMERKALERQVMHSPSLPHYCPRCGMALLKSSGTATKAVVREVIHTPARRSDEGKGR